jgi:hypothetical protein
VAVIVPCQNFALIPVGSPNKTPISKRGVGAMVNVSWALLSGNNVNNKSKVVMYFMALSLMGMFATIQGRKENAIKIHSTCMLLL